MKKEDLITLCNGEDPPEEQLQCRHIDVRGRKEHEAMLRNPEKCKELGLDIYYETVVYLNRWGGWLKDEDEHED